MTVEENVNLMRRWFEEVWNQGNTQTVRDLLAPDAIGVGQLEDGSNLKGPAGFVPFVERIRGAFPDIKVVIDDAFGSGDRVVVRWSATMTHRGDHLGMPATGKAVDDLFADDASDGDARQPYGAGTTGISWPCWSRLEPTGARSPPYRKAPKTQPPISRMDTDRSFKS